ncbi:MAG: pyridoxamine 5'-phosphate oxidase family protein [Thermoguttaceae bacterium]|jgi:uncharacterized pyridoxamine 5'-phosphate oxidase family protein|nr:pyridoxamine 5'-phosphate oxidase family protein [Thermoguttaceae bacterium]
MQRIYDYLKKCKIYYLATVDGDQPQVRPFGTIEIIDGSLCVQTGKSKPVSAQLHANPKIEICACDGDTWLRVRALAIEDPRVESQEKMLESYPELKAMYQAGDGNTEIFKLTSGVAVFSSFTEAPVIVEF